jgi:hypothetical protein
MMAVGISTHLRGNIMSRGVGDFKLFGHVRDLSKSKEKETPPSTPRAKTKEQPHYMKVVRREVKIPSRQSGASRHTDAESVEVASPRAAASALQSPSLAEIDRLMAEVEQLPEDPKVSVPREIEKMIKQLDEVRFDEFEENSQSDNASSSGQSGEKDSLAPGAIAATTKSGLERESPPIRAVYVESPTIEHVRHDPVIGVRPQTPRPSSTISTTTMTTAQRSKLPSLNLANKPDTGEEPPSTGTGLPDVDAIPEFKATRPSKVRGRGPGTPRMGHERAASDQQGKPAETPRKMFTHKRMVTDRSVPAPGGDATPRIGDRAPRTPRILKPDIDVPEAPTSPREKDDRSISSVPGYDRSREKPDNQ